MPIGASKGPIWRPKFVSGVVNYTLIRWEGNYTYTPVMSVGDPDSQVYEIYIFTNGYIEARFGNWANMTGGIIGQYTAGGTGTAFPNVGAFSSMVQNVTYVWDASGTTPSLNATECQYINGSIVGGSAAPSLGAGPAGTWPPSGWTSLQNSFGDDSYVTVPISSTTIMGTARTDAYVGSNGYITFGGGSIVYSSLSTTNPSYDKFMFNAGDRAFMRVAYTTGSK
jgi:hypothetical protein